MDRIWSIHNKAYLLFYGLGKVCPGKYVLCSQSDHHLQEVQNVKWQMQYMMQKILEDPDE